jgi:hypothetical protein
MEMIGFVQETHTPPFLNTSINTPNKSEQQNRLTGPPAKVSALVKMEETRTLQIHKNPQNK